MLAWIVENGHAASLSYNELWALVAYARAALSRR
jgi:hypothetical protein